MKIIYKIAKKELQQLFYSPVAWFMLVVFVVQTAWVLVGKYEAFLFIVSYNKAIRGATDLLFAQGLWSTVQQSVYLYIPLLTMGLISEELKSGSVKLLYSSPITNTQIIWGKFLSMVMYALVLGSVLMVYVIVGGCTIPDFDWGLALSGWLGLFLLICTYAAIGIFVSSLTSYQFVAALGTFIVLAALKIVGGLGQEYDFVRDITWWLCINGRCETFIRGMVCSEDLLYFIILTLLFLGLTIIRLHAVRKKIPFKLTAVKNIGVIALACGLGYLSSRPVLMGYCDATANKVNTLDEVSQQVVKKLDGDLTITGYSNILDPYYPRYAFPDFIHKNREVFERYTRFKPETDVKMVYYYDTIAVPDDPQMVEMTVSLAGGRNLRELAKRQCEVYKLDTAMVKSPEEIRKMIDLRGERTFVWEIRRENGRKVWLRTFRDQTVIPSEAEITLALKRLVMDMPTVAFATGHRMIDIMDYRPQGHSKLAGEKYYRSALMNQGFGVRQIDLRQAVPEEVDILTIANLRTPFTPEEYLHLKQYVEKGGNLFVMGEPRRQEEMNPFLRELFGVELTAGTLVQYRFRQLQPDVLVANVTSEARKLSPLYGNTDIIFMPGTTGIRQVEDKGFTFTPFFKTGNDAGNTCPVWNELEGMDWEESRLVCTPDAGEVMQDYVTVAGLSRKVGEKEQRIVIAGDADCIGNEELAQDRSMFCNPAMIAGSYAYLAYNEAPIQIVEKKSADRTITIRGTGVKALKIGFGWGLPFLLFAAGICICVSRKLR